ncbi:glycoside hydrolase family 16 protein [Immersiella caudata]|uniref:Glycoside hydrolase family 16 protein n=1 Tax=Immersiella caudata TaxID=314043 RepID=A0AA40BWP8_9PEZI|nr:glycoside hydrolase family 16 protein [Immersiella caudata]
MRAYALLPFLSSLTAALAPPNYPGFRTLWAEHFPGNAGDLPSSSNWDFRLEDFQVNNEVQRYQRNPHNIQISGGGTIQIVPRNSGGKWTSGRIESKTAHCPQPGKIMMVEAVIRFGDHPRDRKQGIWPAFWMLGESVRRGTNWPMCGELDIMETVNGAPTAYGTVHCGSPNGGPCNEPMGRPATVDLHDNGWHKWSIKIDLTNGDWRAQQIQWLKDGNVFSTLRGADIGDQGVWGTLAHSPMIIILNLAVGGSWPGPPNANTADSWGSMMEVEYVAVYST